jgi:hypothetical protein
MFLGKAYIGWYIYKSVNKFIAKGLKRMTQTLQSQKWQKSLIILMKDRNQQVWFISDGDGQSLGHW